MVYIIRYQAEYECPKGHRFTARVNSGNSTDGQCVCPLCYDEWVAANVPSGRQVTEPVQVPPKVEFC